MGLDDLTSPESAFVAAVTATVFSPRVRETARRGAVLGLAGALRAGDIVAGAARGAARGIRGDSPSPPQPRDEQPSAPSKTSGPEPGSAPRRSSASTQAATDRRSSTSKR